MQVIFCYISQVTFVFQIRNNKNHHREHSAHVRGEVIPSKHDRQGHTLLQNQPLAICDKTAHNLKALQNENIYISESSFFYDGGGCC